MESIAVLIVGVLLFAVYMIPTLIAFSRGHASKWGIFTTNLLLGLTGIFWVAALIWSLSNKGQQSLVVNVGSNNVSNITQKDSL